MKDNQTSPHTKIAVIGLGYVGLPLAVAFARHGNNVIGIDTGKNRLNELEISTQERERIDEKLHLSDNIKAAVGCDIFIITVPTPVYATPPQSIVAGSGDTRCRRRYKTGKLGYF